MKKCLILLLMVLLSMSTSELMAQKGKFKKEKKPSKKNIAKEKPKPSTDKDDVRIGRIYEDYGYAVYIKSAMAELKQGNKLTPVQKLRLADSYLFTGDYLNAEQYYSQVVDENSDSKYKIRYAQSLQSNGKCEDARKWFLASNNVSEVDASGNLIESEANYLKMLCDEGFRTAPDFQNKYVVNNVKNINSEKYDFSPAFYKDGLVFVSNNIKFEATKVTDGWLDDSFMNLYYAKGIGKDSLASPTLFSANINSKYHEGPLSFTENGTKVYFTRNNYINGKRKRNKKGLTSLKIYSADLKNGEWENVTELPFNSDNFIVCHPTISKDGQSLYFSANFEDSKGGMDLYVSKLENGQWSTPQNLGERVNTIGNEVFPFIHDDGILYFASNRPESMGGLDIYMARPVVVETGTSWNQPENIGEPFNSSKDDFGFIVSQGKEIGYFTSNRDGGYGRDDIYKFSFPKEQNQLFAATNPSQSNDNFYTKGGDVRTKTGQVCILDKIKDERMPLTEVTVFEIDPDSNPALLSDDQAFIMRTDRAGKFNFPFKPYTKYVFQIKKSGYLEKEFIYFSKGANADANNDFCIPVEPRTCQHIIGQTLNAEDRTNIGNVKITFYNSCTEQENTIMADENGRFEVCLPCNCKFKVVAEKPNSNYLKEEQNYFARPVDCNNTNILNLWLYPTNNTTGSLTASKIHMREGMVIELERIYYDFNKYNIRNDATDQLDELVALMNTYPSMEIELIAHTDSRGSNSYNKSLSQKRAEAVVNYLINAGISGRRITASGHGESFLRNDCYSGVVCTEEQHQINRRTEVKIIKLDAQDVKVQYVDNQPETIGGKY